MPIVATLLLMVGFLLRCEYVATGDIVGFPLDDAWIHMTFGRNLAHGLGFGVNPGVPTAASTSVTWSLWLGLLHLALGGYGLKAIVLAVKGTGLVLTIVTVVGWQRIVNRFVDERAGRWAAGFLILTAYPWAWAAVSGMELPLVAALSIWAFVCQLEARDQDGAPAAWRRRFAVLLWTLATLTRPEMLVVGAAMTLAAAGHEPGGRWRGCARLAIWATMLLVPYAVFHYWLAGQPFPQTFTSKMTERALPLLLVSGNFGGAAAALVGNPVHYLYEMGTFVAGEAPVSALLWLGVPLFWRTLRTHERWQRHTPLLALAWASLPGVTIAVGWLSGPEYYTLHHGRYLAQTLLLAMVPAATVTAWAWHQHGRPRWVVVPLIVVAGMAVARLADLGPRYAAEVDNINKLQVAVARWCGENLSPDLRLAVNDIGAQAYFGRQVLIDLEGLITPAVNPFRRAGQVDRFLERERPDLVLIFPSWYPEIMGRPEVFVPVVGFLIHSNVTSGGEEVVLFKMPWSRNLPATWPVPPGTPVQRAGSATIAVVDLEAKRLSPGPGLPEAVPVPSSTATQQPRR